MLYFVVIFFLIIFFSLLVFFFTKVTYSTPSTSTEKYQDCAFVSYKTRRCRRFPKLTRADDSNALAYSASPRHQLLGSREFRTAAHCVGQQTLVDIVDSFLLHESHFLKLSFFLPGLLFFLSLFSRLLFPFDLCFHFFDLLFDDCSVILTHSHGLKTQTVINI